jgi:hypothetical protein
VSGAGDCDPCEELREAARMTRSSGLSGLSGLSPGFLDEPLPAGLLVQIDGTLLGDEMVDVGVHLVLLTGLVIDSRHDHAAG